MWRREQSTDTITAFMDVLQSSGDVDTPPPCMMLLDDQSSEERGLQELTIIALARMIDAGSAAISHVIGSLRFKLVMHDHMVSGKTFGGADRGTRESRCRSKTVSCASRIC